MYNMYIQIGVADASRGYYTLTIGQCGSFANYDDAPIHLVKSFETWVGALKDEKYKSGNLGCRSERKENALRGIPPSFDCAQMESSRLSYTGVSNFNAGLLSIRLKVTQSKHSKVETRSNRDHWKAQQTRFLKTDIVYYTPNDAGLMISEALYYSARSFRRTNTRYYTLRLFALCIDCGAPLPHLRSSE